jgi:His/Glu/Gln/Arg/opine family amino acid ABC transporter permease subunit
MIEILADNYGVLIGGAATTVLVSGVAIAIGMMLGLALAFGLLSHRPPLRVLCSFYRSFWRGTPILVQLLMVFYMLPQAGIDVAPLVAAIIALSLNTAAFQGEIYRAGLLAIPRGEIEAARMLGILLLSMLAARSIAAISLRSCTGRARSWMNSRSRRLLTAILRLWTLRLDRCLDLPTELGQILRQCVQLPRDAAPVASHLLRGWSLRGGIRHSIHRGGPALHSAGGSLLLPRGCQPPQEHPRHSARGALPSLAGLRIGPNWR